MTPFANSFRRRALPVLSVCALIVLAACAPKAVVKKEEAPAPKKEEAATPPAVESGEADIRGTQFQDIPELNQVHFAFDAYSLDAEAREILRHNADYLQQHGDLEILVAGNCDQRGTVEYNLALGQNRAKAVREYYIHLGVPAGSIATISYGKEKPLCAEMTEECWAKNRRAETQVRSRAALAPKAAASDNPPPASADTPAPENPSAHK